MPPPIEAFNILRAPEDYEVTTKVHSDTYPLISSRHATLPPSTSVFITGGSRGLGRAMACAFAQAGATHIAIGSRTCPKSLGVDIQSAAESAARPIPHFIHVPLDVTNAQSVSVAAQTVSREFGGRLNVLVNNAGVLGCYGLVADSDVETWFNVLDVNLKGPYLVALAFLPMLLASQQATEASNPPSFIINVTSGGAHLTNPILSAYQVSKNAL